MKTAIRDHRGRFVKGNKYQFEHGNRAAMKSIGEQQTPNALRALLQAQGRPTLADQDPNRDHRGRFVKGNKYRYKNKEYRLDQGAPYFNTNAFKSGSSQEGTLYVSEFLLQMMWHFKFVKLCQTLGEIRPVEVGGIWELGKLKREVNRRRTADLVRRTRIHALSP